MPNMWWTWISGISKGKRRMKLFVIIFVGIWLAFGLGMSAAVNHPDAAMVTVIRHLTN